MSNQPGWPPVSIRQRQIDHSEIEQAIRQFPTATPDILQIALVRYLVIRSTGLVEAVRDDAASMYSQRIGHPRLHKRISAGLRTGYGVRPSQLLEFIGSFDSDWRDELEAFLMEDDGRRQNDLAALVAARKKIAHGDGDQVTARKALQWSETSSELAKWIIARFDPT